MGKELIRFSQVDRECVEMGLDPDWAQSRQGETGNVEPIALDDIEREFLEQDALLWDGPATEAIPVAVLVD